MRPMTSIQDLLSELEAFLAKHEMPPTTFGLRACNDAHAVRRLRDGYGLTMRRAETMRQFMRDYRPERPGRSRRRQNRERVAA